MLKRTLLFFALTFFCASVLLAQGLPKAFQTAEHMASMERLYQEHQVPLIQVCEYQLDSTRSTWIHMLESMEKYADQIGYDLKSVQVLFSVFWEKDGRMRHLGFSLLTQSKNVDLEALQAFLLQFARQYQSPATYSERFFHEGPAGFPLQPKRIDGEQAGD